ncbi:hypothetical protein C8R43DRAFT_603311 [Mycena crocata]|nr:hypothetical protein C8R43DRAFT_603311 [Mycena crocata]
MFTPSLSFRSLAVFTTLVVLNPFGIYAKAVPRLFDARQDPAPSDSSTIVAPGQPLGRFLNCSLGVQKILGDTFNTSDGCLALLDTVTEKSPANNISLFQFYAVNPEINGDCTNLEDNYNYCLDSNATDLLDVNFEPVPAASVPNNLTYSAICSEFYKLAGEDCIRLQEMFQISGDQFPVLNAENINGNTDCDHLVPDSHVCVRPTNIKVYNANITLSGFLAFNRTSTDTSGTDPSPSETSSVSDSATSPDQTPTDTASQGTVITSGPMFGLI